MANETVKKLNIFYVYIITKPWDGVICYVGKGKRGRYLEHARMGKNHYNPYLARVFAKAVRLGMKVEVSIIRKNLLEDEAHKTEVALIEVFGRADKGLGLLANCTDGGDGSTGYEWPEESRKKVSPSHKAAWSRPGARKKRSAAIKKALSDPKVRKKQSSAAKKAGADPALRKLRSENAKRQKLGGITSGSWKPGFCPRSR